MVDAFPVWDTSRVLWTYGECITETAENFIGNFIAKDKWKRATIQQFNVHLLWGKSFHVGSDCEAANLR